MTLTQYEEGSWRELLKIAFPLIVASFSLSLMLFVDRVMLTHHTAESGLFIVSSGTLSWVFVYGWMALTGISEVFVAQHNGAGRLEKLGEPVWQMIWVSLFSIVFFLLSFFKGAQWWQAFGYLTNEFEQNYYTWIMLLGFSYPLYGALCGFFVGQGRIHIITLSAVIGNVMNIFLDWILIFGVGDVIPSFGIQGAAFATSLGTLLQALFLLAIFLKRSNREKFGTGNYRINYPVLKECIMVGFPSAIFIMLEVFGWATFYNLLFQTGFTYVLVACLCQNVWILFYCFNEGMHKAVITISGNLIGARRTHLIPKMIWSGVKLHLWFLGFMLLCDFLYFDLFVRFFLRDFGMAVDHMYRVLWLSAFFVIAHLFLDGIRLLYAGVLTSSKDTLFLMVACSISIWLFLVAPTYLFVVKGDASMYLAAFLHVFYSLCLGSICWLRYLQRRWQPEALATAS